MGRRPILTITYSSLLYLPIWCAHYHYHVIHHTITNCLRDLSPRRKGNSCLTKLLSGLGYKKIQRWSCVIYWGQKVVTPTKWAKSMTWSLQKVIAWKTMHSRSYKSIYILKGYKPKNISVIVSRSLYRVYKKYTGWSEKKIPYKIGSFYDCIYSMKLVNETFLTCIHWKYFLIFVRSSATH